MPKSASSCPEAKRANMAAILLLADSVTAVLLKMGLGRLLRSLKGHSADGEGLWAYYDRMRPVAEVLHGNEQ